MSSATDAINSLELGVLDICQVCNVLNILFWPDAGPGREPNRQVIVKSHRDLEQFPGPVTVTKAPGFLELYLATKVVNDWKVVCYMGHTDVLEAGLTLPGLAS